MIDLNCDLGESFGVYKIGQDHEVLKYNTSANIACGYHAGDHNVMMETVELAIRHHVRIGAHPGLPDLAGFGRREMAITPREIYHLTIYQIGALAAFVTTRGTKLAHVKLHGALYNMAAKNRLIAEAIAQAVLDVDKSLVLFGLSGSELIKAGQEKGLKVANEVFADRTYKSDGTLTPRSDESAMIHDSKVAVARVIRMIKEGKVMSVDGKDVGIQADTICVHGDEPSALEFVKGLREALSAENIPLRKSW
jgi:UPF0271 protein